MAQKTPSVHHRTTLSGYVFTTKACIDNRKKKLVKQQCFLQMSPQYGELRPTNGWDRFGSFLAPQQISTGFASWLRYCTNIAHWRPVKLYTMFGHLLGWYTYTHFCGLLPVAEFCHLRNSLCVQVLCSVLAALLHATPAASSAKLCGVVQRMELWNFRRGHHHVYLAWRPSRWASTHILVCL